MTINNTFYVPPTVIPNDVDTNSAHKSTWCCFNKGYTPPPFQLVADSGSGEIRVVFQKNEFTSTCNCQIECVLEGVGFNDDIGTIGKFCPQDVNFEVILNSQSFSTSEPTLVAFTFEDVNGNVSTIDISSLVAVQPRAPMGMIELTDDDRRTHAIVAVPLYSASFVSLEDSVDQYQIERYIRNSTNSHIWVDWTSVGSPVSHKLTSLDRLHWDRDILSGVEYGYRVRFRSAADNASRWSSWLTLRA